MDLGAQALAMTSKGIVERYYRGMVLRPQDARSIPSTFGYPIRRVTQKTYKGWRVKRLTQGTWELFSEERGAFMVEYGIHRGGNGRRRPVLRKSAVDTLSFVRRARFGQRIFHETFGNLRNNKGHFGLYTLPAKGGWLQ